MRSYLRYSHKFLVKATVYGSIGSTIVYCSSSSSTATNTYTLSSSSSSCSDNTYYTNTYEDKGDSFLLSSSTRTKESTIPVYNPCTDIISATAAAYSPSVELIHTYQLIGPGVEDIVNEYRLQEHRTKQSFSTLRQPLNLTLESTGTVSSLLPSTTNNADSKDNSSLFTKFPLPLISNTSSSSSTSSTSSAEQQNTGNTSLSSSDRPPSTVLTGASSLQYLLGCNVRCMLGWCKLAIARGYAYGLYLDANCMNVYSGSSSSLPSSLPLFQQLLKDKQTNPSLGELSLVLKMARDIPGEHMTHGFRNSLLNKLRQSNTNNSNNNTSSTTISNTVYPEPNRQVALETGSKSQNIPLAMVPIPKYSSSSTSSSITVPTNTTTTNNNNNNLSSSASSPTPSHNASSTILEELSTFANAFSSYSFKISDEISFVWSNTGQLIVAINDKYLPNATLSQPILIKALFDIYCGEQAVSLRARDTFQKNYQSLAQSTSLRTVSLSSASSFSAQHRTDTTTKSSSTTSLTINTDEYLRIILQEHSSRTK